MLVYSLKLDQGGFPVATRKGDLNPNYITYCRSIISSCKVSAIVQQVVICKSIYILSSEALWTSFSEGCTCCTILAQGDDEYGDSWELGSNKGGTLMFNKKRISSFMGLQIQSLRLFMALEFSKEHQERSLRAKGMRFRLWRGRWWLFGGERATMVGARTSPPRDITIGNFS